MDRTRARLILVEIVSRTILLVLPVVAVNVVVVVAVVVLHRAVHFGIALVVVAAAAQIHFTEIEL